MTDLATTAREMVAPGKGILAADESIGTMNKRLEGLGITGTAEIRRSYRDVILTGPGLSDHISGAILYDETIRQSAADGTPFPKALEKVGIMPGIKVDTGAFPLAGFPDEKVTEGLDGLRGRIAEYVGMGARFAKWRAVITPGAGIPTRGCLVANAHALARYAALCQEGGLVPIVEPEVLMDGDNTLQQCFDITHETLREVFHQLAVERVVLEAIVLKPNMVLPGKRCPQQASVQEVAEATVRVLSETVPGAVPGIAFLSGGQSAEVATRHLNAMNAMGPHPWTLTFSYGRALQDPALASWRGEAANRETAQKALCLRSKCNGAASLGSYSEAMEPALA
jgi:fructose-bisphosphate aldolase class I